MATISIVNYVALTCDEVNTMDNESWISIYTYVMQNWAKVPMLFFFRRIVNGVGIINLIVVIMEALHPTFVFQKLFCFVVDGVNTFQGTK
jgi:hypothetical protein